MTSTQIAEDSAVDSTTAPASFAAETESETQVASLLSRYLLSLDDEEEELDEAWAARLFAPEAVVAFPHNRHEGIEGMAEYHRSALAAFAGTQHHGSAPAVAVDGDRATLRANLISTHVHHARHVAPEGPLAPLFANGTFVTGEARRTAEGWKLTLLAFRLLWAEGNPPPAA